jgi:hypothetical protein
MMLLLLAAAVWGVGLLILAAALCLTASRSDQARRRLDRSLPPPLSFGLFARPDRSLQRGLEKRRAG